MMRAFFFLALLAVSPVSFAQYQGPAVDACRDHARKELAREGANGEVVIERDANLVLERYARKLGNQFVASILTGNGAVVVNDAPSAELGFICLLSSEKNAVFFN